MLKAARRPDLHNTVFISALAGPRKVLAEGQDCDVVINTQLNHSVMPVGWSGFQWSLSG